MQKTAAFCMLQVAAVPLPIFWHPSQSGDIVLPQNPPSHQPLFVAGGQRKDRHGRSVTGKVVISGILKRYNQVDTVATGNAESEALMPVIKKKIMPDSIVYTDSLSNCDTLDANSFTHRRINRSKRFVDHGNRKNHQRYREFPASGKTRFMRYYGIGRKSFLLFLKEFGFRFNFSTLSGQLEMLRDWYGI